MTNRKNIEKIGAEDKEKIVPALTLHNINKRRNNLYNLTDDVIDYRDSLDEYHTSEDRVRDLEASKAKYIKQRTTLQNRNMVLLNKLEKEPERTADFGERIRNIEDILEENVFQKDNIKISTIIGQTSHTNVIGLKLILTDGSVKKYGNCESDGQDWCNNIRTNQNFKIDLHRDEFIQKIDRIRYGGEGGLGAALIFYSSLNKTYIIKPKSVTLDKSKFGKEKTFFVNHEKHTWAEHEAIAKSIGYSGLASITSHEENRRVIDNIRIKFGGRHVNAWIGGIRKQKDGTTRVNPGNMVRGRGSNEHTWRWTDGTPWRYTNWNRGEPNDCCGQTEHYLQIYGSSGKWNDLFTYKLPGVYSKQTNRYHENSIEVTNEKSIVDIRNLNNDGMMEPESENKFIENTDQKNRLKNLKAETERMLTEIKADFKDKDEEYHMNLDIIKNINILVEELDNEIRTIRNLNSHAEGVSITDLGTRRRDAFSNMDDYKGFFEPILNNIKNIYNNISDNINMKEGHSNYWSNRKVSNAGAYHDYNTKRSNYIIDQVNQELVNTDVLEYDENRKYMTELLGKKDSVAADVLMDYMVNDQEGSNVEKVYEKVNQDSTDKLRKIQINDYTTKTYKEFILIIKVIILVVALLMAVVMLNKIEILGSATSLFLIGPIIVIGVLYIIYRLYLLNMKDDKNFDKDRIPWDREARKLVDSGKMSWKPNPFGVGTCIGKDCCNDDMVYDSTQHICIANLDGSREESDSFSFKDTWKTFKSKVEGEAGRRFYGDRDSRKLAKSLNLEEPVANENFANFFENIRNNNNNQPTIVNQFDLHESDKEYTFINEGFMNTTGDSKLDKEALKSSFFIESLNKSTPDNF